MSVIMHLHRDVVSQSAKGKRNRKPCTNGNLQLNKLALLIVTWYLHLPKIGRQKFKLYNSEAHITYSKEKEGWKEIIRNREYWELHERLGVLYRHRKWWKNLACLAAEGTNPSSSLPSEKKIMKTTTS